MFITAIMPIHFENETRKELTRISIQRLSHQTFPVAIILVTSTQEEQCFAKAMHCLSVDQRNTSLSKKYQRGVYYARCLHPDAIMILDSDTWVSHDWCETAITTMQDQHLDGIGISQFSVLNLDTWEISQQTYQGTKVYDPVGTGRLFLARSLDRLGWRLFPDGTTPKQLDKAALIQCTHAGLTIGTFHAKTNTHLLEIRSSHWTSVYSWDELKKIPYIIPYRHHTVSDGKLWLQQWFPGGVDVLESL